MPYDDDWYEELTSVADTITDLRKGGDLREAYELAREQYSQGCREDRFLSSYTWVLYDCLKRYDSGDTKFYHDINAYCKALALIRRLPIDSDRDDLFIRRLAGHVCKVGWSLRKEKKLADLQTLCTEICQWQSDSPLYSPDVARMTLVSMKPYEQSSMVLRWLGVADVSWATLLSSRLPINVSGYVAEFAVAWALYDDVGRYDEVSGADLPNILFFFSVFRTALSTRTLHSHEGVKLAVKKFVHFGWCYRKQKTLGQVEMLLAEATQWSAASAMHCADVCKMFLVALKDRPQDVIRLAKWYGLDDFTATDFVPREYEGKQMPSFAQNLTKSYLDALTETDESALSLEDKSEACDCIIACLRDSRCSDWIWESYKLGKLLCQVERYEDARTWLHPIVIANQAEPWAWQAYGKTWEKESPEKYEKCLFMGLFVAKKDELARNLHEDAAQLFAQSGRYSEAKGEIALLDRICDENGWSPSKNVASLKSAAWYADAVAAECNKNMYKDLSQGAIDIVAELLPWIDFYVDHVVSDKRAAYIMVSIPHERMPRLPVHTRIKVKRDDIGSLVEDGSCYRGHFDSERKTFIGSIEPYPEASIGRSYLSTYSGELDLVRDFGFVNADGEDSIWVSPALLQSKNALQHQQAKGNCRKSYKPSKDPTRSGSWRWEATTLELGSEPDPKDYERRGTGTFNYARDGYQFKRDFGFVTEKDTGNEFFVSAQIVSRFELDDGDDVEFTAEKSWDKKKKRWGWKVTEILIISGQ